MNRRFRLLATARPRLLGTQILGARIAPQPFMTRRYLSSQEYHEVADDCLEGIVAAYEELSESCPEVDADLSQGVLTLALPPLGTYVINKQPPNQQIWLASPVSGPKRFDYVDGKWVYSRDNSTLGALLKSETLQALHKELPVDLD